MMGSARHARGIALSALVALVAAAAVGAAACGTTSGDPEAATAPGAPVALSCAPGSAGAPGIATGGTIQYLVSADRTRELDDLQAVGARWIRLDLAWSYVQAAGRNSYDWSRYDIVMGEAAARHLQVLGTLAYTPRWAAPSGATDDQFAPTDARDYARFAAAAVRRYAPTGVHAWEIWNEPNSPDFWKPVPSVTRYTTLFEQAYASIKGVDPAATVLTGGTAPEETTSNSVSAVDFLSGIYANGGGGSFDAVATHSYSSPATPLDSDRTSGWSQMDRTRPSLRSVMMSNGNGSKRIWATEYGAPTSGSDRVTDAEQANMISEAYRIFRLQPWAGPLFVYTYKDRRPDENDADHLGLFRSDGSRKPSWKAFRDAAGAFEAGCVPASASSHP